MQAQVEERTVFCETHGRHCRFAPAGQKCSCCGKKFCLCNYVL